MFFWDKNIHNTQILQEEIHELLLSFAEAGATVVRLKGGDPLVRMYRTFSGEIALFACSG